MARAYTIGGMQGAAIGALIGSFFGVWSVYSQKQRRRTRHLGLPDLVYLDQHDDVVYALSCMKRGSAGGAPPVHVDDLAVTLNDVASLAARVETEEYPGHLQWQLARRAGLARTMMADIAARKGRVLDPAFDDHLQAVHQFLDDTEHNNRLR